MSVQSLTIRRGSGGSGRTRGGDGIIKAVELLAPAVGSVFADRHSEGPPGLAGGQPGAPGRAHLLGRALYSAHRYADAIDAFKKIVSPRYMHLAETAACHARIDDQTAATELAAATLRLNPDFTVEQYMRTRTYQDPADAAHLAEGLRAAGLPG